MAEPALRSRAATRCGFIALLGAPNAGKSTLINRLVGTKVSIVSPKVQTTRNRVLGIAMFDQAQAVFLDTPGIFAPKARLQRAMVHAAWSGARDADLIVVLIDAGRSLCADARRIIDGLRARDARAVAALNKIDAVKRPDLLTLASAVDSEDVFSEIFMISALTGDGVTAFAEALSARLPMGP
ncbi:MAG: GTPase Era, partial [Alphaproteobacteria bacterium]|nr:GTPase Era [Alphaproteobacteria bacterium]